MQSSFRLKENRDFRRVFQRGRSYASGRLVLYYYENRHESFRVGFSVSKKIGNAVIRNRLKRVLRSCFQKHIDELRKFSIDFVVVCRKPAAEATYDELELDLLKLLRRGKFMV